MFAVSAEDARERVRRLAGPALLPARRRDPLLVDRLRGPEQILAAASRRLAAGGPGSDHPAAEWLLDNYYVVERSLQLVREEFSPAFERRLPRLADGELRGYPVAYQLAGEIVVSGAHHVDVAQITALVADFQTRRPLTIAEVWALPVLLRIVLLESLAAATTTAFQADGPPGQSPADQTVPACIRSLRTLETTDWKAFFEQVNETERILREDPAGVYARMDFDTRDRYRGVVEDLAARSGWSEDAVAREAVRLSGQSTGDRCLHVGYHLIDQGVVALEQIVGYRSRWSTRWRRGVERHPTPWYLGAILLVGALHVIGLGVALLMAGASLGVAAAGVVLAVVPAMTIGVSVINLLVTRLLPVRVLPKMDFSKGIPVDCRTTVAVPVLLASRDGIAAIVSRLSAETVRAMQAAAPPVSEI
jgi:cyclic beta-1,2-glucan synthetase